ncbi:peptidase inhibitor family I36 protein [Streptomyces sp. CSDS2]|uniref:peptidase inhibitor family I36 protein n=1 Tax=Streptomyces sp. CSDS2 TaxID=3055051 RepID=UPI0025B24F6C|nr:peptidase inhibitor family I36 protein [Streptomyces sp. CSDS2]MDN3265657.1 peptidase inhibitor family I36 protein [Streptomyces sp. CSDS2]
MKLHVASAVATAVLTAGIAVAPATHAETTAPLPQGCREGYFCMYPQKLYRGQVKLFPPKDIPVTGFGASAYNATTKCANLYRQPYYKDGFHTVAAHQGWGVVPYRTGSLKFVECPK